MTSITSRVFLQRFAKRLTVTALKERKEDADPSLGQTMVSQWFFFKLERFFLGGYNTLLGTIN
jgi:hypothetical protein